MPLKIFSTNGFYGWETRLEAHANVWLKDNPCRVTSHQIGVLSHDAKRPFPEYVLTLVYEPLQAAESQPLKSLTVEEALQECRKWRMTDEEYEALMT